MGLRKNIAYAIILISFTAVTYGSSSSAEVATHYDHLKIKSFTGTPEELKAAKDSQLRALRNLPLISRYSWSNLKEGIALGKAYEVLTDPEQRLPYDVGLAELIPKQAQAAGIYAALGLENEASIEAINARIDQIKEAIAPAQNSPGLSERALRIIRYLSQTQVMLDQTGARAKYDVFVKKIEEQNEENFRKLKMESLSKTERSLRGFGSFAAGNAGFMAGMWFQLWGQGVIENDPAKKWAAWDSLHDSQGLSNLLMFGAGSQGGAMVAQFLGMGPIKANNLGMVGGSIASHFLGKGWNSKEGILFRKEYDEWFHERMAIWGHHVIRREIIHQKINDNIAIIKNNPKGAKAINAANDLPLLQSQFNDEESQCENFRHEWRALLGKVFWQTFFIYSKDELVDIGSSTLKLVIAASISNKIETTISGFYAKLSLGASLSSIIGNKKTFDAMTPAQREDFILKNNRIQELREMLKNDPEKFKDESHFSELKGLKEEQTAIAKKNFTKATIKSIGSLLDNTFGRVIPDSIKLPMKRAFKNGREYFAPDPVGEVELASSLGRRIFLHQATIQAIWAVPSAITFLSINQIVDNVSSEAHQLAVLQYKLGKAVENLPTLASEYVDTLDPLRLERFKDYLEQSAAVWNKFREAVIMRGVIEELQYWNKWRTKKQQKLYLDSEYLAWLLRGGSLKDKEFLDNSGGGAGPWHEDTQFPYLFNNEKNYYQNLVKPFNADTVKKYLDFETDTVNHFLYTNATDMHIKLRPMVDQAYYSNQAPLIENIISNAAVLGQQEGKATWAFTKLFFKTMVGLPPSETELLGFRNSDNQGSSYRLRIPNNMIASYFEEVSFLESHCLQILSNVPRTPLVVALMETCAERPFNTLKYADFFKSEVYTKKQNFELPMVSQPEDRADLIALSLAATIKTAVVGIDELPQSMAKLLMQPENPQEDKSSPANALKYAPSTAASTTAGPSQEEQDAAAATMGAASDDSDIANAIKAVQEANSQNNKAPSSQNQKTPQKQNH